MARTKQTARKTNAGKGIKGKKLASTGPLKTSAKASGAPTMKKEPVDGHASGPVKVLRKGAVKKETRATKGRKGPGVTKATVKRRVKRGTVALR